MIAAGTRVRLTRDVERYPHFIAPAGATGTVVDVGNPDVYAVRLDQILPGAEQWENEVHWYASWDQDPTLDIEEV